MTISRIRQLVVVICVLLLANTLYAQGIEKALSLTCEPGDHLTLVCSLENMSEHAFWLLMAPFELEGPLGHTSPDGPFAGELYTYMYVEGERFENTLEYGVTSNAELGGPILFKPTDYLEEDDLDRLVLVQPEQALTFEVDLKGVPIQYFQDFSNWLFRPKVIVAKQSLLSNLEDSGDLPPYCITRLSNLRSSPPVAVLDVRPRKWNQGIKIDACLTPISEQFSHVLGNTITINTTSPDVQPDPDDRE